MPRLSQVLIAILAMVGFGLFSGVASAQPGATGHAGGSDDEGTLGPPASNVLGAEDIWANPSFTGGTGNNGETAHSEW